jgi:glutathione S-transferase
MKAVPYKRGYIDFAAKPDWLLAVNPKGAVPVAKDLRKGGEWVVGSDVICDRLEDEFPEPAMGHVGDAPEAGSDVFPAFTAYLKAPAGGDADQKAALDAALGRLAEFLKGREFIGPGPGFGSGDASLAPKLHHMAVALPHFKEGGWAMPPEAEAVGDYLARVRGLPAWQACAYSDDAVIAGWNRHLGAH